MIQILGLRSFVDDAGKDKKYDAFFENGWHAPSLVELFDDPEQFMTKVPKKERWNLFYTIANCTDKKREFASQSALAFDIDGLDVSRLEEYIRVVCKTLGVKPEQTATIFTGNGLHFYVGLQVPIIDKAFFTEHREHYRELIRQLDKALAANALPGNGDPSVFDARRLMRLPGTENRKPGKEIRVAKILQPCLIPIAFDITLASGIPQVGKDEQVDAEYFKKFPKTDNAAILSGCNFIKHAASNPIDLDEPHLYAALSIVARMENGKEVAHKMFEPRFGKRTHGGTVADLDMKLTQSMSASGPRTCKSINNLWEGCRSCPNNGKVTSPIMLLSPDTIKTEATGFHDVVFDQETQKMKRGKPNYEDLRKFFEKKHAYVTHAKSCFIWTGKIFEEYTDDQLRAFAQKHFNPACNNVMAAEFLGIVYRTNLVPTQFWETTLRKVNFENGILDLTTNQLTPHSMTVGFKAILPYAYDPTAKCPTFDKFLDDVTCGSKDLQSLLIEFGGYSLSGDEPWAAKMLVLEGDGRNGKSTLIKALKAVAGNNSYAALGMKLLMNVDRRASLDGALFNICEEAPKVVSDTSDLKALSAGDEITVRRLYKEPYQFVNRAKLIFSCNSLPKSQDTSHGYFERFCIVPFNATFDKSNRDPFIFEKIKAELPGIFNLFHAGYKTLLARRMFIESEESLKQLDGYKEVTDSAVSWFKEQVTVESEGGGFITIKALFASYSEYVEMGLFKQMDILDYPSFQKRMVKLIPGYAVRRDKQKGERGLKGVAVPELATNGYGV